MSTGVPYFPQTVPALSVIGRISATAGATEAFSIGVLATLLTINGTSVTSMLIGTGAQTFTTQANLPIFVGQLVQINSIANPVNNMFGQVTAYNSTTGVTTVNVLSVSGSGTLAAWNILASGPAGSAGTGLSNTRLAKTAFYTVANADKGKTIALGGAAFYALTFNAGAGYDANFQVIVVNEDTARGKSIVLSGGTNFILWPGQSVLVFAQNNVWQTLNRERWRLPATQTFYLDTVNGVDTSDGLGGSGGGSGCFKTAQFAIDNIFKNIDCAETQPVIQVVAGSTMTGGITVFGQPEGASPEIFLIGNTAAGSQITWNATGAGQALVQARDNGIITIEGFAISANGFAGCTGFNPSQNGIIDYMSITFGAFPTGIHIDIGAGGSANCLDASVLTTITGSATYHIRMVGAGAMHSAGGATINMPNVLAFTSFVNITGPSCANWGFCAFTGAGSGAGSTGQKFALDGNAVFYKGGTTLPCVTAGAATNGGQSL